MTQALLSITNLTRDLYTQGVFSLPNHLLQDYVTFNNFSDINQDFCCCCVCILNVQPTAKVMELGSQLKISSDRLQGSNLLTLVCKVSSNLLHRGSSISRWFAIISYTVTVQNALDLDVSCMHTLLSPE